jgi:hypothetical protein
MRQRDADSIEARRENIHAYIRPDICTQPDSPTSSFSLAKSGGSIYAITYGSGKPYFPGILRGARASS